MLQPISQQSYNSIVIRASLRPSTTLGLCRSLYTSHNQAGSFASFNAAEFNPQRVNNRLRSSMLLAKGEICEQSPFMAASRARGEGDFACTSLVSKGDVEAKDHAISTQP